MRPRDGWRAALHLSLLLCLATPVRSAQGERSPGTVAALLRQTRASLKADHIEQARASAEKAAAQQPESSEAQYLLGLIHERRSDLPAAAAAYGNAIRLAPALAEAHDRLGFVLGQQGRTAEAIAEFAEAVRLDPTLFDAQYHLGATRWWTRDTAGALPALTAAVALQPAHAEARYYLGITLQDLGRLEPGIEQLREAVRLNPAPGDCSHSTRDGPADPRRSGRRDRAARGSRPPRRLVGRCAQQPRARAVTEGPRRRSGRTCCGS